MSVVQTVKLCLSLSPLERHTKFRPKFGPLFPSPSSLPFPFFPCDRLTKRTRLRFRGRKHCRERLVISFQFCFPLHSFYSFSFFLSPTHTPCFISCKQSSASGTQFGALMRPISSPLLVLLLFWSRVLHLLLLLLSLAPSFRLPYRSSSL